MSEPLSTRRVDVLGAVRTRWVVVAVTPLVLVLTAVGFLLVVTPQFRARASLHFSEEQGPLGGSGASLGAQGLGGGLSLLAGLTGVSLPIQTDMEVIASRALVGSLVDEHGLRLELTSPSRTARSQVFREVRLTAGTASGEYTLRVNGAGGFDVEGDVVVTRDPFRTFRRERRETTALGTVEPGGSIQIPGASISLTEEAARHRLIRFEILDDQEAVDEASRRLGVTRPQRDAEVVEILFTWPDPEVAANAVNFLAERFIEEREERQSDAFSKTAVFLAGQLDSLGSELVGAEFALRDYREREQVVEPIAQASAAIERLADLQVRRELINAERDALSSLLDSLTSAAGGDTSDPSAFRRLVFFPTLFQNPATAELLRLLGEVENERAVLMDRRTADAREVVALDARVHEIEFQLKSVAITYLTGLENQAASLDGILDTYSNELDRIPAVELEYVRRRRRVEVLTELYTFVELRQMEAEVTAASGSRAVRVLDAAEMPSEPASPNAPLTLALALLVGITFGVGTAVALEHSRAASEAPTVP